MPALPGMRGNAGIMRGNAGITWRSCLALVDIYVYCLLELDMLPLLIRDVFPQQQKT
jgi:hypothetical protein